MRRCEQHGRFGCADYECQRAESARHSAAWIELRDGGEPALRAALRPGSADTDRAEPALTADQSAAAQCDSEGE